MTILFWGCKGDPGRVYLSFDWVFTPSYLYLDDPNMPETIYRLENYITTQGSYYLEYTSDSQFHWLYYTLSAQEGEIFFKDGANMYYEIGLWAYSEPSITSNARAVVNIEVLNERTKALSEGYVLSDFINISDEKTEIDLNVYEKKTLSYYEESVGGYKLEAISGIYVPIE